MKTKKIFVTVTFILFCFTSFSQSEIFVKYQTMTKEQKPEFFKEFIFDNVGIGLNKDEIKNWDMQTLEDEVAIYEHELTEDTEKAIQAVEDGKKVIFFIDKYVFGICLPGKSFSGSWQKDFPMASGFYYFNNKCFEKVGLNYHVGAKEKSPSLRFYIIKKQ